MSGFSASEAALEGFRITRENPRAFGAWVAVSFARQRAGVVIDAFMPAERASMAWTRISADQTLTLGQLLDTLILIAPVLVLGLAVLSVMAAAVYRLIFRHDDTRFGYLRLGADELRLMGLTLIYIGLFIALVVGGQHGLRRSSWPWWRWPCRAAQAFMGLAGRPSSRSGWSSSSWCGCRWRPVATFAERRLVDLRSPGA